MLVTHEHSILKMSHLCSIDQHREGVVIPFHGTSTDHSAVVLAISTSQGPENCPLSRDAKEFGRADQNSKEISHSWDIDYWSANDIKVDHAKQCSGR